jgi:hypothetical protein
MREQPAMHLESVPKRTASKLARTKSTINRWRRYAHAGGATVIIVGGIPAANSSHT